MAQKEEQRIDKALRDLEITLDFYERSAGDEPAAFLAVVKAFEISVEYGWKELKQKLVDEGVAEELAPKGVIRKAAQVGLMDGAERWIKYINARNSSVHDYYGMTQSRYVELAREFLKDARKLFK